MLTHWHVTFGHRDCEDDNDGDDGNSVAFSITDHHHKSFVPWLSPVIQSNTSSHQVTSNPSQHCHHLIGLWRVLGLSYDCTLNVATVIRACNYWRDDGDWIVMPTSSINQNSDFISLYFSINHENLQIVFFNVSTPIKNYLISFLLFCKCHLYGL